MDTVAHPTSLQCPAHCYTPGYRSRESLKAHLKAHHRHPLRSDGKAWRTRRPQDAALCPVDACRRGFHRPDDLLMHLDAAHGPAHARTTERCATCGWSGSAAEVRAHHWSRHTHAKARIPLLAAITDHLPPLSDSDRALLRAMDEVPVVTDACLPPLPPVRRSVRARGCAPPVHGRRHHAKLPTAPTEFTYTHQHTPPDYASLRPGSTPSTSPTGCGPRSSTRTTAPT